VLHIAKKTTRRDFVRKLIPDVAVSTFAVVPADVVFVAADTAEDDAGVNSSTAVGFSDEDTADNIKYCTNRLNKVIM